MNSDSLTVQDVIDEVETELGLFNYDNLMDDVRERDHTVIKDRPAGGFYTEAMRTHLDILFAHCFKDILLQVFQAQEVLRTLDRNSPMRQYSGAMANLYQELYWAKEQLKTFHPPIHPDCNSNTFDFLEVHLAHLKLQRTIDDLMVYLRTNLFGGNPHEQRLR